MIWLFVIIILIPLAFYGVANAYAILFGERELYELEDKKKLPEGNDAILVLGAGVRADGTPSAMLEDRLLTAVSLWESKAAEAVIVSGDHGKVEYDEVNVMKEYLIGKGIPSDRIFMDHAGFSTYDSLYRARAIFGAEQLVIVTQQYHAYRALMIGRSMGIDCTAVAAPILSSEATGYAKQPWYTFRETVARAKDLVKCFLRPDPAYLGERIPLEESGDVTNDKKSPIL